MKKSTLFAIISAVALISGFFINYVIKDIESIFLYNVISGIVAIGFAVAGIVFASKDKTSKALPIVLLVLGILLTLGSLILFGATKLFKNPENTKDICKDVVQCEKDKDGVSICHIKGDDKGLIDIKCYDSILKEDQYKD